MPLLHRYRVFSRAGTHVPAMVKAANLARWFPLWTVSREQWTTILRSSVSGVAVDTLLFSRIGVPLLHRYRVFSRAGTHVAFHGTYMARVRAFIEESDIACLRSHHRRCARAIASQMTPQETRGQEPDISAQYVLVSVAVDCYERVAGVTSPTQIAFSLP